MIYAPAVVVHSLAHARQAVAAGLPVCLVSAPGAALSGGCLWWRGIVDTVRREAVQDMLDCADAPGRAMAALRIGQRHLILDPGCPAFAAVAAAAASIGAHVQDVRPNALDLGRRGAERHLRAWLEAGDTAATLV